LLKRWQSGVESLFRECVRSLLACRERQFEPVGAGESQRTSLNIKPTRAIHQLALAGLLLAVTAVWGWTFTVVKDAVSGYGVVAFLALRFAVGSCFVGAFACRGMSRRTLLAGAPIGVVLAVAYLFQTFGLRHTSATNCGLITGLFAVFAPIINRLVFGVRTPPVFWAAVGVSLLGLALLTGIDSAAFRVGDLLTLACAACFGLHIALLDRHAKHYDAAALTWVQLTTATVVFYLGWPLVDPWVWPNRAVWFALLITGVVATAVGFGVQTLVQQRLSAVRTAVIIVMEPLFAAIFGYLLAGDRLTPVQQCGAGLMVAALFLAEVLPAWAKRRAARDSGLERAQQEREG
jgi:drug/metabolite transporter (DMT)-like permease